MKRFSTGQRESVLLEMEEGIYRITGGENIEFFALKSIGKKLTELSYVQPDGKKFRRKKEDGENKTVELGRNLQDLTESLVEFSIGISSRLNLKDSDLIGLTSGGEKVYSVRIEIPDERYMEKIARIDALIVER